VAGGADLERERERERERVEWEERQAWGQGWRWWLREGRAPPRRAIGAPVRSLLPSSLPYLGVHLVPPPNGGVVVRREQALMRPGEVGRVQAVVSLLLREGDRAGAGRGEAGRAGGGPGAEPAGRGRGGEAGVPAHPAGGGDGRGRDLVRRGGEGRRQARRRSERERERERRGVVVGGRAVRMPIPVSAPALHPFGRACVEDRHAEGANRDISFHAGGHAHPTPPPTTRLTCEVDDDGAPPAAATPRAPIVRKSSWAPLERSMVLLCLSKRPVCVPCVCACVATPGVELEEGASCVWAAKEGERRTKRAEWRCEGGARVERHHTVRPPFILALSAWRPAAGTQPHVHIHPSSRKDASPPGLAPSVPEAAPVPLGHSNPLSRSFVFLSALFPRHAGPHRPVRLPAPAGQVR